ncbi:MAG TPA: CRISPR-associated protein Csx15 [Anaerolineae bacterium]|nr:CRISPR-associated protein Csx15 [Anaerolineae bacterium]
MLILNYSHPLTPDQLSQLEALTGAAIAEVREIPAQLDLEAPFAPQAVALADAAQLTPEQWQTTPLLLVPPALNFAAVALLAELHGRMGYFPPVVRLRPVAGALPPRYEVAEIINLQAVRDAARKRRG